jgi:import inner membrane translocase subunit TIM50
MPNVPHDIPVPHTLVLDLEETLVSSSWDRKHGWRYAKRPGVDKFLHDMAQYYEIVLYSPSLEGVADPVVNTLDKSGAIMHRLFREKTHFVNGTHVKDLGRLNRNLNRIVVLDDDPAAVQLNPGNLIRVKPYLDATDREDQTLARITPLLIEIAREGYNDVPAVLSQFEGMDADQMADEHQRRIDQLRLDRQTRARGGLGRFAGTRELPPPELSPADDFGPDAPKQLTAKDLVGAAPPSPQTEEGVMGWLNRRNQEKAEEQTRKMEYWNEVMLRKQAAQKKEKDIGA